MSCLYGTADVRADAFLYYIEASGHRGKISGTVLRALTS